MTITEIVLIVTVGLAAGFLNAVSGGGGILTVSALIFIGIPPGIANGTNRIAVVVQNIIALVAYQRLRATNNRFALALAVPATIGALCGALVSVRLDDAVFRTILAITMLVLLVPVVPESRLNTFLIPRSRLVTSSRLLKGIFFVIGLYGGFMQIGVGIFVLVVLNTLCSMDLVFANGMKVVIVLFLSALSLLVFIIDGKVDWGAGLLLAAANGTGAWFGAHWGVRKGDFWIRIVLVATGIVMALQLLGAFSWIGALLER